MKISSLRPFRAIRDSKFGKRISKAVPSFRSAFTLIEILVVISIIAVLASLLFPAMGAVRDSARRTSAKNDVMQIVNAVRSFYVDFGRYPVTGTDDVAFTDSNSALIGPLRSGSVGTINTRGIRYLEIPEKKDKDGALYVGDKAKGSIDSAGNWRDPWGNVYQVYIDGDYNDELSVTFNGVTTPLRRGVAAKSLGKSGTAANAKTDVVSWE